MDDIDKFLLPLPLPDKGEGANVVFSVNQIEMLKISQDGFYVRGKKLDVDDNEAESVYRAFKQFLIWYGLVRE